MSFPSPKLTPCQSTAWSVLKESKQNIFLTGAAGTGKSFLIKEFLRDGDRKNFPVLASTGAAAVLIGGRTFHSFFGIGFMEKPYEEIVTRALENRRVCSRLRKISGFVLDEVSMIPGQVFQAAEEICRKARGIRGPWGGARVIAVGDFLQLPPVSQNSQQKDWAFLHKTWHETGFVNLALKSILRTQDLEFLSILNVIRFGGMTTEVKDFLDAHVQVTDLDEDQTFLFPRRAQVDAFNQKKLTEIDSPLVEIPTVYAGSPIHIEKIKRVAPVSESLFLKKSAFVMVRINDPMMRFVNGSVGFVEDIDEDILTIRLKNQKFVELDKKRFELFNGDGHAIASAINFPVNLAYALTIHKAQGTTLDTVVSDLRELWEPGQAYVALSRLRSSAGLTLTGWDQNSIRVDPEVKQFYSRL